MRKPDRPKSGQIFRCAIYTRKSSDEGLEQEFNSLDAQREACEAYARFMRRASAQPANFSDSCRGLKGGAVMKRRGKGRGLIQRHARTAIKARATRTRRSGSGDVVSQDRRARAASWRSALAPPRSVERHC
jgi:hypothetical protein